MARENVEAFKRAVDAGIHGDLEALLKKLNPEVSSHPTLDVLLGGEAAVCRDDLITAIRPHSYAWYRPWCRDRIVLGLPGPVQRGTRILGRGYLDPTLESAGLLV
jgi:hypothetical protein